MHGTNIDFYKVIIEARRRDTTEFFRKQRLARLQRQEMRLNEQRRQTEFRAEFNLKAIRRLMGFVLKMGRGRTKLHATK